MPELCISVTLWSLWPLSTPKVPLLRGQSKVSPASKTVSASEQQGSFCVEVVGETSRRRISGNAGRSRFGQSLMIISLLTQEVGFLLPEMCWRCLCLCSSPWGPF